MAMNRRVIGSFVGAVALVACLGAVGATSGFTDQKPNCSALMNKVGEQAKAVVRAQNGVNVARKSLDDCHVAAKQAKQKNEKVDCTSQETELKKRTALLHAEQDKLEALQKEFNSKCK
jgi:hypothetical protein